jgi:hypothetical protein
MDTLLNDKIKMWPEQFMSYLIEVFKSMNGNRVYQPLVITKEVDNYRHS